MACRSVSSIVDRQRDRSIRHGRISLHYDDAPVAIVRKQDQRTGKRTIGLVKDILTSSAAHPHGIKVRLQDGQIGRVQEILDGEE
jgi:uncharacterized repeat protein (TIGR03833 family)